MPVSVPLTGLAANDPVPGQYLEVNFAQGPVSGASGLRAILLLGNKSPAGDATPDTVIYGPPGPAGGNVSPLPLSTVQDASNRFGQGSELHRMYRRVTAVNTTTPIYAVAVTESAGVAATLQINILGSGTSGFTGATTGATARTWVGEEFVDSGINTGDNAATTVTGMVTAVNSKLDWAVTAAANVTTLSGTVSVTQNNASITFSTAQTLAAGTAIVFASQSTAVYYLLNAISSGTAGTLTTNYTGTTNAATTTTVQAVILTAKNKGLRGNWLRGSANIISQSQSGVSTSVAAATFFTNGTTADSNTNALATILATRFYYIVSAAEDVTQFGALNTQVNAQALPTSGLRERCFAGSVDTLANVTTVATGINGARAEVTWLAQSDWTPAELAANAAAIAALGESSSTPKLNFSGYGNDAVTQQTWRPKAPRSGVAPTRANILSALNNGITPIGVLPTGATYLVKRVTTRSLSGSNNDYRIRDAHKVTVCDFFGDDWVAKCQAMFQGMVIGDDPLPGQRVPGRNIATPRVIKSALWKLIDDYADRGLLQNADAIKAGVVVNREPGTTSRMSVRVPLQPVDILDQIATAVDQTA